MRVGRIKRNVKKKTSELYLKKGKDPDLIGEKQIQIVSRQSRVTKRDREPRALLVGIYLRFKNYINRLLFPLYLFPVKTITYSTYYIIKFFIKTLVSLIKILFETIIFPFRSLKKLPEVDFY